MTFTNNCAIALTELTEKTSLRLQACVNDPTNSFYDHFVFRLGDEIDNEVVVVEYDGVNWEITPMYGETYTAMVNGKEVEINEAISLTFTELRCLLEFVEAIDQQLTLELADEKDGCTVQNDILELMDMVTGAFDSLELNSKERYAYLRTQVDEMHEMVHDIHKAVMGDK